MEQQASEKIGASQTHFIEDIDASGYLDDEIITELEEWEENVDCTHQEKHEVCETEYDGFNENFNVEKVIGKEFTTPEEAQHFYNQFALLRGFGTKVHYSHKKRATNEIFRRLYVCNKQGFKILRDNNQCANIKKRRRDLRTGCEAMLRITKEDHGKWVVDIFNDVHNHPLSATPTKVLKHRSHSKFHLQEAFRDLVAKLNGEGLRPSQIKKSLNAIKGTVAGRITSKQVIDSLSGERKSNVGKECYGLMKYLQNKAASDSSYYFAVDLDLQGCLQNVFWADGRSRESYLQFGDVVVFDVTYMTNKFKMPFAPFVGVNHHGQSILFGAGLLNNEKEETFVWLFENFKKCMFDKSPDAIITDQDGAIGNAISIVFPNSRHRFCAWHIKRHVLENLRSLRAHYSDFNDSYIRWVKSETVEEFENGWQGLSEKYMIEEKSWLAIMYNLRKYWVKAYLKDVFFAVMTTSGRSESIHSFFYGYVNSSTMLNDFIMQYDKAVDSRRAAEDDEDFKTMNSKPVLTSINPIEIKAGECYTAKLFEIFKKEWLAASNDCTHETLSKNSELVKYKVGLMNVEKSKWKTVDS